VWGDRIKFFDRISSELNNLSRSAQTDDVLSTALKLQRKARKTEHILNVVINDLEIPSNDTDASIRYLVEREQLVSSPLVREALVTLAVHDPDFKVRRLAWLHIYKQNPQDLPLSNPGGGDSHGKFGVEMLRRLRRNSIRNRSMLGPRGTILNPAEVYPEGEDVVPELLKALANPLGVERKEVALTLGEIGGGDVAIFLADALRSEIEARSVDEDYQVYLASALSNLSGPDAVEGLLRASEQGSERVRLAALSGLESLATAGTMALTEHPEPATIDSEEMRSAYLRLAERLADLISALTTPAYVRHKAEELLDTIRISLNSA
jgi:hypothetical protein